MTTYDLKLITKPPMHHNSVVAPEDLPALRRYQAVLRYMRRGLTEEEGIARYDRPTGKCEGCGDKCPGRARRCSQCYLKAQRLKSAERVKNKKHWVAGKCSVCGAPFFGHPSRENCDDHRNLRNKPVKDAKPKKVKAAKPAPLPPTWEKPAKAPPPPSTTIINPGVQVTRLPSAMRHWRDTDEDLAAIDRSFQSRLDGVGR